MHWGGAGLPITETARNAGALPESTDSNIDGFMALLRYTGQSGLGLHDKARLCKARLAGSHRPRNFLLPAAAAANRRHGAAQAQICRQSGNAQAVSAAAIKRWGAAWTSPFLSQGGLCARLRREGAKRGAFAPLGAGKMAMLQAALLARSAL